MFRRFELHNHTTESDAQISCGELLDYMVLSGTDGFALTDHNTISGHGKIEKMIRDRGLGIMFVRGMEFTTYYGHILCFPAHHYIPWENIDRNAPEKLFSDARKEGAVVGIAHPFSLGDPFARGCRFEMCIHDLSSFDFIEIVNNSESDDRNAQAVRLYKELVLSGHPVGATAGMDLHGFRPMEDRFAAYVEQKEDGTPACMDSATEQLLKAGRITPEEALLRGALACCRTWISRGMILRCELCGGDLVFTAEDAHKPGFIANPPGVPYLVRLTSDLPKPGALEERAERFREKSSKFTDDPEFVSSAAGGMKKADVSDLYRTFTFELDDRGKGRFSLERLEGAKTVLPELLRGSGDGNLADIVCVSPAVRLR